MLIELRRNGDFPKEIALPQEASLLEILRNIAGRFRAAVLGLGLLGVEPACYIYYAAKYPIQVPPSNLQPERRICVVPEKPESKDEEDLELAVEVLIGYLREKYSNIKIIQYTDYINKPADIMQVMPEYVGASRCDDILSIRIEKSPYKHPYTGPYTGGFDIKAAHTLRLLVEVVMINAELNTALGNLQDSETCIGKDAISKRGAIFTLLHEKLLDGYHPDKLPSLSVGRFEQEAQQLATETERKFRNEIEAIYGKYTKTDNPIPDTDANKLRKLGRSYLTQFGQSTNAEEIRRILSDIDKRIARHQEKLVRQAEKKRLALEKMQSGEAVRELRSLIARAQAAEGVGNYEAAYVLFDKARQAGWRVSNMYKDAGILIPYEIDSLGFEIERGLSNSKSLLGISQPRPFQDPSSPVAAVEEGFRALRDIAIELVPTIGAMAVKAAEIGEQLRGELRQQGFTADLEIRMIHPDFLMYKPIQNVEIAVTSKNPPYSSNTFKATKEGIVEQGGRAMFYLRPGRYEISSPVLDRKYEIEVKEGRNSLTVELR